MCLGYIKRVNFQETIWIIRMNNLLVNIDMITEPPSIYVSPLTLPRGALLINSSWRPYAYISLANNSVVYGHLVTELTDNFVSIDELSFLLLSQPSQPLAWGLDILPDGARSFSMSGSGLLPIITANFSSSLNVFYVDLIRMSQYIAGQLTIFSDNIISRDRYTMQLINTELNNRTLRDRRFNQSKDPEAITKRNQWPKRKDLWYMPTQAEILQLLSDQLRTNQWNIIVRLNRTGMESITLGGTNPNRNRFGTNTGWSYIDSLGRSYPDGVSNPISTETTPVSAQPKRPPPLKKNNSQTSNQPTSVPTKKTGNSKPVWFKDISAYWRGGVGTNGRRENMSRQIVVYADAEAKQFIAPGSILEGYDTVARLAIQPNTKVLSYNSLSGRVTIDKDLKSPVRNRGSVVFKIV